jgi:A1 cistron-splicing factor AAR2
MLTNMEPSKEDQEPPGPDGALFSTNSEDSFTAILRTPAEASPPKMADNPTFMQNQITIKRNPSSARDQASALTRNLSKKSSGHDVVTKPGVVKRHSNASSSYRLEEERGRELGDSYTDDVEITSRCSLTKTPSERSTKSVRSVHAVGSYPLGSLRVHSPSPTRSVSGGKPDECLKSGDVFIVRDVPGGSLFGYDTIGFSVKTESGSKFNGIRDIPPGTHFIWGGSSNTSLRNGFWIVSAKRASDEYGEVHVRRWDKENEILAEEVSKAEVRIQRESVPEIFDNLHPYMLPFAGTSTAIVPSDVITPIAASFSISVKSGKDPNLWHRLTSCIKGALITKITGKKEWNEWHISSVHECLDNTRLSPDTKISDLYGDNVLKFIFPNHQRTFTDDSVGRARTEQALDSTSHVLKVISNNTSHEDADEIIGEAQFCYVTGMLLGNFACMEQWAHIVKTMFRAFDLVLQMPEFVRKFIEAVHAQFSYDDEGLEGSILDHDPNLSEDLKLVLTTFKARLNEMLLERGSSITKEQSAVGTAFGELETLLWKWDWDLRADYVRSGKYQTEDGQWIDAELKEFQAEDERGEYAPAMVELDEDGREKGLICF